MFLLESILTEMQNFFLLNFVLIRPITKEKKNSVILIVADTILFISLYVNFFILSDI